MRKVVLLFLFLLSIYSSTLSAEELSPEGSRGFEVKAFKDPEISVTVTPDNSNDPLNDKGEGMPFYLTSNTIKYNDNSDGGRKIATWSVFSNSDKNKVFVMANPLRHISGEGNAIDYVLRFNLNNGYSLVESGLGYVEIGIGTDSYENGGIVGKIGNQNIAFMLSQNGVDISDDEEYPVGTYSATVSIMVEGVE